MTGFICKKFSYSKASQSIRHRWGFLVYCVKHGLLIREGNGRNAKYYVTKDGKGELEKFGIRI